MLIGKRNGIFIRYDSKLNKHICLYAALCGIVIASIVLFFPPVPGVADQGDFQRVMSVTGLEQAGTNDLEARWFKFVTSEYKMNSLNPLRFFGIIPTTSMIYPIAAARAICKLAGSQYFNTRALALVYIVIYIASIYVCIKNINIRRTSSLIFFSLLSLIMLMDGNYLVWFNSLYGEPMMIIGLLALTGSILYFSRHTEKAGYSTIIPVCISAFLFIGSKAQCLPLLPFVLLLISRISFYRYKEYLFIKKAPYYLIPVILMLIFYAGGIYVQTGRTTGVDTAYNSVFYGILKNSKDPQADLNRLGLSSDMAVEAGKHAYLPREQYVKYAPWSDLTMREFSDKINNFKLLAFYLLQPDRLLEGMEYTASQSFDTQGFLGKFESSEGAYKYSFNRFTLWSHFRNTVLPKKLIFIAAFYSLIILVSIIEYVKRRKNKKETLLIELLWLIVVIGLLQFPMPYIGNGEADTGKQLFLFNYTFDMLFLVSAVWIFDKFCCLYRIFIRGLKLRS